MAEICAMKVDKRNNLTEHNPQSPYMQAPFFSKFDNAYSAFAPYRNNLDWALKNFQDKGALSSRKDIYEIKGS